MKLLTDGLTQLVTAQATLFRDLAAQAIFNAMYLLQAIPERGFGNGVVTRHQVKT